jgi:hypothetical protein
MLILRKTKRSFPVKVSLFHKLVGLVLLGGLFLTAACSTGTSVKSSPTLSPSLQEQDPEFWRMWQDRMGVSG